MDYSRIEELIANKAEHGVRLGNPSKTRGPNRQRIIETEDLIGTQIPPSFLWFLEKYGGGTIFGDEINSIQSASDDRHPNDLATATIADRRRGFCRSTDIPVLSTDFGELFVLDASNVDKSGEYPVCKITGKIREVVAENFVVFLQKYISETL